MVSPETDGAWTADPFKATGLRHSSAPVRASNAYTRPSPEPRYRRSSRTARSLGPSTREAEAHSSLPSARDNAWITPSPSATWTRPAATNGPCMGPGAVNDQRSAPSCTARAWITPSSVGTKTSPPAIAIGPDTPAPSLTCQRTVGLPIGPFTAMPARLASPRNPGHSSTGACVLRMVRTAPTATLKPSRSKSPIRASCSLGMPTATCDRTRIGGSCRTATHRGAGRVADVIAMT